MRNGNNQRLPRINGPLLIGFLIVVLVAWMAIQGPELAPLDPLERAGPLRVDGEYLRLPYPPGTPGHPLGTDNDGRDMLSRILWGIRPTLSMVVIVAAIRLVLGTVIGLAAGWSQQWFGRFSDTLIRGALSIPVIMVALGGIAAVGVDLGIWAFVVGLSLTGWVEAARIIRERTTAIRKQVYIEASHSLGAGDFQILFRHVLRQVLSLLWMLFAFEISSTLMLTAALGFLGYYIGGDVWVQVTDAVAEATSGTPELGQMLATTGTIVTRPWPLLTIGGVVFVVVLGFNLLGEGLRRRASLAAPRGRTVLSDALGSASLWVEDRIVYPLARVLRTPILRAAIGAGAALLLLGAGRAWYQGQDGVEKVQTELALAGPIWGTSSGDPAGTRWLNAGGPESGEIAWTFQDPSGFAGGPVVAENGQIIVAGLSGALYALEPDGSLTWQTRLPAEPAAGPALDATGRIFVPDVDGGLSAFSPVGTFLWRANAGLDRTATAAPVVGADGWIYYPTGPFLQAVTPDGEARWQVGIEIQGGGLSAAQLAGNLAFLNQGAIDLAGGALLPWYTPNQLDQYMVSPGGDFYYRKDNEIYPLTPTASGAEAGPALEWDFASFTTGRPQVSGVAPGERFWMFYSSFARGFGFGEDTRVVWLDQTGNVLTNAHYGTRNSIPIGIDSAYTLYSCGNIEQGYGPMDCQAFAFGEETPHWTLPVEGFELAGGALAPERLYITTTDGFLHAIGAAVVTALAIPTAELAAAEPTQAAEITQAPPPSYSATATLVLTDASGFTGAPAAAPDGSLFIIGLDGTLYRLHPNGEITWQIPLEAKGVDTPVINGDQVLALDRAGLSAYGPDGQVLWRYAHTAGTAVAGPVVGPDGRIFYTIQTGSRGNIQALTSAGEALWTTQVETFSYYKQPQVSPNGQLVFFAGEVYNAASGVRVDLQLDFEPNRFIIGADRQLYLLFETTFVRWTYSGGRAVLAEDRIISPFGTPQFIGVLEYGEVWMMYRSAIAWFDPAGGVLGAAEADQAYFANFIGINHEGLYIACGRNRSDFRQQALPNCVAFSQAYEQDLWNLLIGEKLEDYSGGIVLPGGAAVALENGELYLIKFELEAAR